MPLSLHPTATACGKVIVLGEHAVVYGTPALAAGLPQGLMLRARALDSTSARSRLTIPAWDVDVTLAADTDHPVARAALEVLGVCDGPLTGHHITGDSHLPAGAGLGSSAALSVALARLVLGPDAEMATVVDASLHGERVFHGQPSGVDSEVAARGGLVRYVRGQAPEPVAVPSPIPLVVVDSGAPRRTADLVAGVRVRHDRFPTVVRPILDAVAAAVGQAIEAVERNDLDALGELMTIDHGLLTALGVSSPILDELCSTALLAGARGAKLTGAGGGGCIVALPPDDPAPLLEAYRAQGRTPLSLAVG